MRAGEGRGGSTGNPRCVKIVSTTARSSIVVSRRSRPPQSGQANTSMAHTRRSKSAQATYAGRTEATGVAPASGAEPLVGGTTRCGASATTTGPLWQRPRGAKAPW